MRLGIRARVFLATLALALVIGLPAGLLLEVRLRAMQIDRIDQILARDAAALGVQLDLVDDPRETDTIADRLGEALDVRLTVIAADGTVLGDSERDGPALTSLESHADRPEVIQALAEGRGSSQRHSTTVSDDLLYVALRREVHGRPTVLRAATRLSEVSSLVWQLRVTLLLGGALALVLAAASGGLVSSWIQHTLGRLVERAQALQAERERPLAPATDEVSRAAPPRPSMRELTRQLDQVVHDLASERDRLSAVLDAVVDGVIAVDANLRVSAANPPARALLGRGNVLGRRLAKLAPTPELVSLADAARTSPDPQVAEVCFGDPPREVHVTAAPVPSLGGCVLVMHDLTEVRALERVRRDFVANVSHELRTPVSVIAATTETLLDGAIDDPELARDFTEAVARHARRLGALVGDLLSLSRMEAGRFPLEPAALDVAEAVHRVATAAMERRPERERPIEIDVAPGLLVWADHGGLDHLLTNLVVNAVTYTDIEDRVAIRARATKRWILIEVADEGPGIPLEHRDRVFERFYRVDKGRSRDAGGTGLGLAIVRHLANLMGGSVELASNEPRGCVFTVRLPRARHTD